MSIFSEENKAGNKWFKFTNVGDRIEGTLISINVRQNKLSGLDQTVYELLDEDGQVWNIGSKPAIDRNLNRVRPVQLGQIIGFEFASEIPSKETGKSPTKIITVYANPNIVNEKWLKEYQEAKQNQASFSGVKDAFNEDVFSPTDSSSEPEVVSAELEDGVKEDTKIEDEIFELAKEKIRGVTTVNFKSKVMATTRLPMVEANYPKIAEKLRAMA